MTRAPSPFFTGIRPRVDAPAPMGRKPPVRATVTAIAPVEISPAIEELAVEVRRIDTPATARCDAQWCQRPRHGHGRFCRVCLRGVGGDYARAAEDLELAAAGWTRANRTGAHWRDPVAPHNRVTRATAIALVRRDRRLMESA